MGAVTSPLKYHGGKHYLAKRIVAMMPPHTHYVEPFAGGLSVLLAKDPEGVSEVVNDLNGDLSNFWAVLREPGLFHPFRAMCESTPFSEETWREATEPRGPYPDAGGKVRAAWAFFVRCRQSMAGRMRDFAAITRNRTRRGMNEQASAWLSAVDGLTEIHARLKRVVVLNRDALDVIRQQDGPGTLFYLDPPYCPDTRTAPSVYRHEMTLDDHNVLLARLEGLKGRFLLSGYRNELYDVAAKTHGWHRADFDLPNHAAGGGIKRRMTECVWANFEPVS